MKEPLTLAQIDEIEARLKAEKAAREQAAVDSGTAVRVAVVHLDGETIEEARERALAHHGTLDGKQPIFDVLRIHTGVEPSEKIATSSHEPTPYDYDEPRESARHGAAYSPPRNDLGPPPKLVITDDGHSGHYLLGADGLVTLCDAMGRPLGDEWRSRIAIAEDPDRVARALLRQHHSASSDDGNFGRRRLFYPDSGWT